MLAGNRRKKQIVSFVLALTLLLTPLGFSQPASASTSLASLQKQQEQLKRQQAENASKLKSLKSDKAKNRNIKMHWMLR